MEDYNGKRPLELLTLSTALIRDVCENQDVLCLEWDTSIPAHLILSLTKS